MNILFICKYNRFRSRVAEAYFKKINKNKDIKIKSAGIIQGSYPIDEQQYKIAKEFEININGKPQGVSTELLKWLDIMVIVANDVPKKIFRDNKKYGKNTIVWKIKDENFGNEDNIRKIISKIIKKVDKLNIILEKRDLREKK